MAHLPFVDVAADRDHGRPDRAQLFHMAGLPTSPAAWMIRSQPRIAAAADWRNNPCVSEMTPMFRIYQTLRDNSCCARSSRKTLAETLDRVNSGRGALRS